MFGLTVFLHTLRSTFQLLSIGIINMNHFAQFLFIFWTNSRFHVEFLVRLPIVMASWLCWRISWKCYTNIRESLVVLFLLHLIFYIGILNCHLTRIQAIGGRARLCRRNIPIVGTFFWSFWNSILSGSSLVGHLGFICEGKMETE